MIFYFSVSEEFINKAIYLQESDKFTDFWLKMHSMHSGIPQQL